MNKNLIFRILGALASALIVVSVFVPFVSVKGYTSSLWQTYEISNALYLPIIIIVFGTIGVVFFSLNVKTEFAYMSTGAVAFFVIMQTMDIVNQGVFNTLSIGYYFLVIGALLTGIMAFLLNLKHKNTDNVETINNYNPEKENILNQMGGLYNNQTTPDTITPIPPVDNVVEPIQPINSVPIAPVQPLETPEPQMINTVAVDEIPERPIANIPEVQPRIVNPVVQDFEANTQPSIAEVPQQPINPVIQEFSNPVISQFDGNQFTQPKIDHPIEPTTLQQTNSVPINTQQSVNPVIQEFTNSDSSMINQNSNVDIFGQPTNK